MTYYIGLDLGTSATKLLLLAADGTIQKSVSKAYPISRPQPHWSEQAPEDWWNAAQDGIRDLLDGIDPASVKGIGVGGQMQTTRCCVRRFFGTTRGRANRPTR